MDALWRSILWHQFGAAIDALENAIAACPDELWSDRGRRPEFWYTAYHAIFWLDLYLSDSPEDFHPPAQFTLSELDPAGLLPERIYSRQEMLDYLDYCRQKCRTVIGALTGRRAAERYRFGNVDLNVGELHLYNMRHVQHHAGQLNLLLRQAADIGSGWTFRARIPLRSP